MYWQIEYQENPTRCLRVLRNNGSLLRCWHNEQALAILNHREISSLFSLWRICGIHRYRLSKQEVKQVLLIAAQCALEQQQNMFFQTTTAKSS